MIFLGGGGGEGGEERGKGPYRFARNDKQTEYEAYEA